MEAMLQRVFKVITLCMDTRSQSFPPLVNGLIHDALLQSSPRLNKPLLKNDFFTWPRYSSYSTWVRWANLQPSNVKFLQNSVCQKWLKSVNFRRSYSKNKNVSVFGTQCRNSIFLLLPSIVSPLQRTSAQHSKWEKQQALCRRRNPARFQVQILVNG